VADTQQEFVFIDPGCPRDAELELALVETIPADPSRGWLPAYVFEMQVGGHKAGGLNLRIGTTHAIEMFFGHIGYAVEPEHRGHHYAERACRLIFPVAKAHGLTHLWIMCNPGNIASRRTCERLGATLVDVVKLPEDCELYRRGDRESCRYLVDLR
jgi:predicted acetyltransferase